MVSKAEPLVGFKGQRPLPSDAETDPPRDLDCYITPTGLARFRAEQKRLQHDERPRVVEIVSWAAGNGDRSENGDYIYGKRRLREIDRRLRFLDRRLRAAIVVDPTVPADRARILFGAHVTYLDEDENERTVAIVGVDEADLARGEISLASPVARALLGARVGDEVRVGTPRGEELIEIRAIDYPGHWPGEGRDE